MLGVGFYFMRRNKNIDDYYVGGRNMNSLHIGLSVVATDVGGGFSIGLGGLGFAIGLAGSWMLFTGLIGAWLSAVVLIPRVFKLIGKHQLYTFPEIFRYLFNPRVALIAGIISAIGYIGFTSAQILAGAKLASATFPTLSLNQAVLIMGITAVVYTVLGGLKAVIYTDTVQWLLLMGGLIFIGIPMGYVAIGGWEGIKNTLDPGFLDIWNIEWNQLLNWGVTIIPIWFIGMTLYQRIYASRSEKVAKKAWFIAGLFEWPIMAFMGVLLGLFARVAVQQGMFEGLGYGAIADMDSEMGLPVMLRTICWRKAFAAMSIVSQSPSRRTETACTERMACFAWHPAARKAEKSCSPRSACAAACIFASSSGRWTHQARCRCSAERTRRLRIR